MSFVAWREWIYGTWPDSGALPPEDRYSSSEISPVLRRPLLEACHQLLYQDEFLDWSLESAALEALGDRYLSLVQSEGEPLAKQTLRPLLQQGVAQIVTPSLCDQLQARLYRVAPLLRELYEDADVWQWAVIAADALDRTSPQSLETHPLLLGLVGQSLQVVLDREIDWSVAL
jgi:hypothetical protein